MQVVALRRGALDGVTVQAARALNHLAGFGEEDAVAEVLAAGVATGEARAWCEERVRVWRERRGAR